MYVKIKRKSHKLLFTDVGIALIASFKRMKDLSQNVEEVRDAIKDSDLLEVDATGTLVRRKVGLGDPALILGRTLYAVCCLKIVHT